MKILLSVLIASLTLAACGGVGSLGSAAVPVPVPVVPKAYHNDPQVALSIPFGNSRVLLETSLYTDVDLANHTFGIMPSFVIWDSQKKALLGAFKLSVTANDIARIWGVWQIGDNYGTFVHDMRATADGGVIMQFDVAGPKSTSYNHMIGQMIVKIKNDYTLDWYKFSKGEQYGGLEVRADRFVSTGAAVLQYDLLGNLLDSTILGAVSTSSLTSKGVSIVGGLGGYFSSQTPGTYSGNFTSNPITIYGSTTHSDGGVILVGDGQVGGLLYPTIVKVDADGTPVTTIKLNFPTTGGQTIRSIDQLNGNYYVTAPYVTNNNTQWVVCKLSSSLAVLKCIAGDLGSSSGSNFVVRAAQTTGLIYVTRARNSLQDPLMVFDGDLNPVIPLPFSISMLASSTSALDIGWRAPTKVTASPFAPTAINVGLSVMQVPLDSIDTSNLTYILK